jgi:hypothetical protein
LSKELVGMSDSIDKVAEHKVRFETAMHAVMTGVGYAIVKDPKHRDPKQNRTGLNSALLGQGAIAKLLIDKGVFTEEEYWNELANFAEAEKKTYEDLLSELFGTVIVLH